MELKQRGAITVYMSIILVAMIIIIGGLIDAARIRIASTQVQRAVSISLSSILAAYHPNLKETYGLFALNDNNEQYLEERLTYYIHENLMTSLGHAQNLFDEDIQFLNLYDYRIEDIKVTPIFNLTENEVTRNQIVQYMKYRAPKEIVQGFADVILAIKQVGPQTKTMEKKIQVDKGLQDLRKEQERLALNIQRVNAFNKQNKKEKIHTLINEAVSRMKLEKDIKNKEFKIALKTEDVREAQLKVTHAITNTKESEEEDEEDEAFLNLLAELATERIKLEKANNSLRGLRQQHTRLINSMQDKTNVFIKRDLHFYKQAIEEAIKAIEEFNEKCGEVREKIKETKDTLENQEGSFAGNINQELERHEKQIGRENLQQIKKVLLSNKAYIDDIKDDVKNIPHVNVYGWIKDNELISKIEQKIRYSKIEKDIDAYDNTIDYYLPTVTADGKEKDNDPREEVKKQAAAEIENKEEQKPEVAEAFMKTLPSYRNEQRLYPNKVTSKDFSEIDSAYVNTHQSREETEEDTYFDQTVSFDDESFSVETMRSVHKMFADISYVFENTRDEIYVNEYIIGTFKNAVSDKVSEKDLRYMLKGSGNTPFGRSEVEYILIGDRRMSWNENAVKAQILGIRFAMNTLHIYGDPAKNKQAFIIAKSVAGWTGFGIPIIHTLVMCSWAMGESLLDIHALLNGEKAPFYKTIADWRLSIKGGLREIRNAIANKAATSVESVATDLSERGIQKATDMVQVVIADAINTTFEPVYQLGTNAEQDLSEKAQEVIKLMGKMKEEEVTSDNEILRMKAKIINFTVDTVIEELKTQIDENVSFAYQKIDALKDKITEDIQEAIKTGESSVNDFMAKEIHGLTKKIDTKTKELMEEGINALEEYIEEGAGMEAKNRLKGALVQLTYQDYLRLFLMVVPPDKKINRVEDLIQLNITKQQPDFKLANYNTYVRVEVTVSIKYMFLTQPFMPAHLKTPEGDRHQIRVIMYEGY